MATIKCEASGCKHSDKSGKIFYQCEHCHRWWCSDHGYKGAMSWMPEGVSDPVTAHATNQAVKAPDATDRLFSRFPLTMIREGQRGDGAEVRHSTLVQTAYAWKTRR
jgi:hypothetical protein